MSYKIQIAISGKFCNSEKIIETLSSHAKYQTEFNQILNLLRVYFVSESSDGGADIGYLKQVIGSDQFFVRSVRVYTDVELEKSSVFWVFGQSANFSADPRYEYFNYDGGCRLCGAGALRNNQNLVINTKLRGSVAMDESGLVLFRKDLIRSLGWSEECNSSIATRDILGPGLGDWCEVEVRLVMPSLDGASRGIARDLKSACSECGIGALYHSPSVPFEPKYTQASTSSLSVFNIAVSHELFGRSSRDSIKQKIIVGARRDLLLSQQVRRGMPKEHLKYLDWIPVEYTK